MANPSTSTKSIDRREYELVCGLLRDMRIQAELSQKALGDRLSRPQTFVSDVELAARRLDALQLREWARACGMTLTEFAQRLDKALDALPPPAKKAVKKASKKSSTTG